MRGLIIQAVSFCCFSFYLRRATDWIACAIFRSYSFSTCHDENSIVTNKFALYVHISVYKKALPITDRKGELALYHLRLHRSIYIHINSNASCPVTWTNRKNLCQISLYINLTFWVLRLKSYLP